MANVLTTQIIVDGPRNLVVKVTGTLDSSDVPLTTIVTPSATFGAPPLVQLMYIDYAITDPIEIQLQWQGTPNQPLLPLAGRGRMGFVDFGGIPDNAITPTGNIQMLTTGYTAPTQVFTLVLEMTKIGQVYRGVR
jgi:hypothetical protein